MHSRLGWGVFWSLLAVFLFTVASILTPALGAFVSLGILRLAPALLLLPLGVALVVLIEREGVRRRERFFLLLTGLAAASRPVFVLLHGLVYTLASYVLGAELWVRTRLEDEPVFFVLALVVCPIVFLVGAIGTLVLAWER